MAAFTKFNQFVEDLAKGVHNLDTGVLKIMLTNSAPLASNTILSDITEITPQFGYSAGGGTATFVSGVQTSGTFKLVLSAVTFTASGGSIGPFRYAVLYNSTPTSPLKPLIAWYDYTTNLTTTDGNQFTVSLDQSSGTLTIT